MPINFMHIACPNIDKQRYIIAIIFFSFIASPLYAQQQNDSPTPNKNTPIIEGKTNHHCYLTNENDSWIDKARSSTHKYVCSSVRWVDGLFGDNHPFDDNQFSGNLGIGLKKDEKQEIKPKLRLRIKAKLPNASNRLNAFIGRVEEDSYVSNTEINQGSFINEGLRSTNDGEDEEWLIGLGYRNPNQNSNGFDYSLGIKLSNGLNPYAKVTHRYLFRYTHRHFWKTTQTGFWRKNESFGASSKLDYTYIMNQRNIIEWDSALKYTKERETIEWGTSTSWHHSLSNKKGISTQLYIRGETKQAIPAPEFGFNITHVRPFLRPWLFVESSAGLHWQKKERDSNYKSSLLFSVQLQMLLGDFYKQFKRKAY